jgi:hypothetical protein
VFLFRNQFDISKPIIISGIQGLLYLLFLVVFIIDVFQMAFSVPLVYMLENDIDRQYATVFPSAPPANCPSTTATPNLKAFKDPQAIRSFYDLQMNNYKMMKDQYKRITEPVPPPNEKGKDCKCKYRDNLENPYKDGAPDKINSDTHISKSRLDENVKNTLKYWQDNSSNLMKEVNKTPMF